MKDNSQHIKSRATIAQKHLKEIGFTLKRHDALGLVSKLDGYRNYVSAVKGAQHKSSQQLSTKRVRTFRDGFERTEVVADYVGAGGQCCPACGSGDLYDKLGSNASSRGWEILTGCSTCGYAWWAIYTLAARDGLGLNPVRAKHLASPDACPFCVVSFDLDYGDVRAASKLYQSVKCNKCLKSWMDLYDLTDAVRTEDVPLMVIEESQQLDITELQEHALLAAGLIYDSGDGYYHIENGKSWADVDAELARRLGRKTPPEPEPTQVCWSCERPVSKKQRAANDGLCPHCKAELAEDD
jgi:hypothetical protein